MSRRSSLVSNPAKVIRLDSAAPRTLAGFADKKELALQAQKSRTTEKTQRKVRGPEAWNETRRVRNLTSSIAPARPRRSRRSPRRNPRQRGRNGAYRHSATERCWQKSNVTPSPCAEASFPAPDAISKQFSQSRLRLEVEAARCRRGETGADVRPRDGLGPSYRRAVECTSTAAGRKASADLSSKLPWAWQRSCRPTCAVLAARQKHRVARCCCRRQGWCGYEFALSHPKTPLAGSDGLRHPSSWLRRPATA